MTAQSQFRWDIGEGRYLLENSLEHFSSHAADDFVPCLFSLFEMVGRAAKVATRLKMSLKDDDYRLDPLLCISFAICQRNTISGQ